jgi:hypothetical protein
MSSVTYDFGSGEDSGQRTRGHFYHTDNPEPQLALFEWRSSERNRTPVKEYLKVVRDYVPTPETSHHHPRTKVRTLEYVSNIAGRATGRSAVVYRRHVHSLINLDEVFELPRPPSSERLRLAIAIAASIRSLHVDIGIPHPGIRAESFVFQPAGNRRWDFNHPLVLDWARVSTPNSFYHHPGLLTHSHDDLPWYYDVWAFLVVLSEIVDWRRVIYSNPERNIRTRKDLWRVKVTSKGWNGGSLAEVFKFALDVIMNDRETLELMSPDEIEVFFNRFCNLLEDV